MTRFKRPAFVFALFFALAGCQYVKERVSGDLPTTSIEELSAGLQAGTVKVIDNNSEEVFLKNHIPTAIHMNPSEADAGKLPADTSAALVFYCKNKMCMASHAGARVALGKGYTNVKVLPDGIDGWMKAGKPVERGSAEGR